MDGRGERKRTGGPLHQWPPGVLPCWGSWPSGQWADGGMQNPCEASSVPSSTWPQTSIPSSLQCNILLLTLIQKWTPFQEYKGIVYPHYWLAVWPGSWGWGWDCVFVFLMRTLCPALCSLTACRDLTRGMSEPAIAHRWGPPCEAWGSTQGNQELAGASPHRQRGCWSMRMYSHWASAGHKTSPFPSMIGVGTVMQPVSELAGRLPVRWSLAFKPWIQQVK